MREREFKANLDYMVSLRNKTDRPQQRKWEPNSGVDSSPGELFHRAMSTKDVWQDSARLPPRPDRSQVCFRGAGMLADACSRKAKEP